MAAPAGHAKVSYLPKPHEQGYYGALFQAADVQRQGKIGGAEAVRFFSSSKLPVDTLKTVWTVADNPPTNYLDPPKFAVALRLIQLLQNQQRGQGPNLDAPPGVTLRPVHFEGISGVSVPMPPPDPAAAGGPPPPQPQQSGPPPPAATGGPPQLQVASPPRPPPQQQQLRPPPIMALTAQDPYTLTPGEQARYESLFPEYAKEGFVYGSEAVPLFSKSGLPQPQLAAIWNMVDTPVDNRLDKLEFALAMHLIVCVSKKNLPLPPALPVSLKQLKAQQSAVNSPVHQQPVPPQAPSSPGPLPPPAMQQSAGIPSPRQQMQPPAVVQMTPQRDSSSLAGSSLPGPPPLAPTGGLSISDAFEGLNAAPVNESAFRTSSPMPAPHPVSFGMDSSHRGSVPTSVNVHPPTTGSFDDRSIPEPASAAISDPEPPKTTQQLKSSYNMGEANEELTKLKAVLQKLQAENISLKATMGSLTEEEKDVQKEINATVAEISELSNQLTMLRAKVLAAKSRLVEASGELKLAREKKGVIKDLIAEANTMKAALDEATAGVEAVAEASQAQAAAPAPAAFEGDLFGFDSGPVNAPLPSQQQSYEQPPTIEQTHTQSFSSEPSAGVHRPTPQYHNNGDAAGNTHEYQNESGGMGGFYESGHHRIESTGSGYMDGEGIMGGGPTPLPAEHSTATVPQYSYGGAPTGSYDHGSAMQNIDELKAKLKEAESVARDAEESRRQLTAQAAELRRVADEAETKARQSAPPADGKKKPSSMKGLLGRGKKKHDAQEADKLAREAKVKRDKLLEVEAQIRDANSLAADTKKEADRLRKEVEDAELNAASAASMQQPAAGPAHPEPSPTQQYAAPTNGYGYPSQTSAPEYSYMGAPMGTPSYGFDQKPPQPMASEAQQSYGDYDYSGGFDSNVMGGGGIGGLSIPSPGRGAADVDPYSNPFES